MGVYINMEMPTSCGDCKAFVCYKQWAGDMGDCFCGITKEDAKAKEKNADCPLAPVPEPHGRLGDLDELYVSLKKWLIQNRHSMTEATRVWIRGVLEGIAAAPTIIPASFENPTKNARYSQDNPAEEGE